MGQGKTIAENSNKKLVNTHLTTQPVKIPAARVYKREAPVETGAVTKTNCL